MSANRFEATYLIETPLDPAHVAEVLAGEQSCGTFTRVEGETDALRERARATVGHRRIEDRPRQEPEPWSGPPSGPREWPLHKRFARRSPQFGIRVLISTQK